MLQSSFIKLKVCGMVHPENQIAISVHLPDYMGFVFFEGSVRFVGKEFSIPKELPLQVKKVGVFVNEQIEVILGKVSQHQLDYVQLHGDESPEMCSNLRATGVGVIKAFAIDDEFDFLSLKSFEDSIDFFLFDAKGIKRGGNGVSFDWSLLKGYDQGIPFFLSGGIGLEDIDKVKGLAGLNIHAVDVNSSVEDAPGVKNVSLIEALAKRLNNAL